MSPETGGQRIPCALCGASDTRRVYTKFKWGIERCRRCGLVFANPRAPEAAILARYSREYFWNEYLPAAGAPGGKVDYEFIDGRNRPLLDVLRRHAPDGTRLLEVGCGAGFFLKAASRAGWQAAGIELSSEAAAFARERLDLDVRQERAEVMTFPRASFDVAVMSEVIEHLFDPRAVLEAIRGALRPGGLLLITTPNFDAASRFVHGVSWEILSPLEHTYYFTEATLAAMLRSTGFEVVESRPVLPLQPEYIMNPRATHAADGWRARLYRRFIDKHEMLIHRFHFNASVWMQMHGRADTLIVTSRAAA